MCRYCEWPERIEVANYAVAGVLALTAHPDSLQGLQSLPWLDVLTKRDGEGKLSDPAALSLSHHFGCLFAHLTQWQLAADLGGAVQVRESTATHSLRAPGFSTLEPIK